MKRTAVLLPLATLAFYVTACSDDQKTPFAPDDPAEMPAAPLFSGGGGVSGANFTTTNPDIDRKNVNTKLCLHGQDGDNVINCNMYGAKPYVWLNGGPLAAGLESGTYMWTVLAPGGQPTPNDGGLKNLSDDTDPYTNRTFEWNKAANTITYSGTHDLWAQGTGLVGTLGTPRTASGDRVKLRVGVNPPLVRKGPDWYANTTNPGGVYILAICRISSPSSYPVNPRDCKYDAFKVTDKPGPPEVIVEITPSSDVNPVGHLHIFNVRVKAVGGTLPYKFNVTANVNPSDAVVSDACTATNAAATDGTGFIYDCTVSVNYAKVALVTLNIAATVTDANGSSGSASTGANSLPSSDDGKKFYVDAEIAIAPSAKNGIGEQHVFTVTFTAYPGVTTPTTFNSITYSVLPTPSSESSTCGSPTVVGNVATCTVTINSSMPGVFTANATGSVTMGADQDEDISNGDGATVIRTTDGQLTVPGGDHSNSGPAIKEYFDGTITWVKHDDDGQLLGGAEFKAERIALRAGYADPLFTPPSPVYTGIVDCMAGPCAAGAGLDQDPAKGKFKLTGLLLGTWRVTETKAPTGFRANLTFYQDVTIDLTNPTASLSGSAAQPFVNERIPLQGCTPGFWKQEQHYGYWQASPYSPFTSKLVDAFSAYTGQGGYSPNMTMRQALDLDNSTGIGQVLRHGVAALLNAYHPDVAGYSPTTVKRTVNDALLAFDRGDMAAVNAAHSKLQQANELGCSLSGQSFWQQ